MELPDPDSLPRRDYLRGLVAAGGMAALAACLDTVEEESVPTGSPDERPSRQHAWNAVLDRDDAGNVRPPEHHVLLALDLTGVPDESDREQVETAFQSLERAYAYDPEGLLFTVGYGPSYFEQVGTESPIPEPEAITSSEDPALDEFDTLVQLASDNPNVVLEAEEALLGEVSEPNGVEMEATLEGVFERGQPRRTGFVGPGLPAQHTDMNAVPDSIPDEAPFFMGFKSGFTNSQAPEDRVTIQNGPYQGGTTTHVESLDLQLQTWFEQDDHFLRVAQLFSPGHAEEGMVPGIGEELGASTGIEQFVDQTTEDAADGLVGHAQKAARARDEDGIPPLLRRDFNTVDGDFPGVHFLAHQRSVGDFVRVREAMAGADLAGSGVGQAHNNGIGQYIFVTRRGNFLVPPRSQRSLPRQ
jgi:dye decolorizing peroxidase